METIPFSPARTPIEERWGNREVCLCIHGFLGTPGMYRLYTDMFREAGIDMYAPLLTGHGTKPEDMLTVSYESWLADIRGAMDKLLTEYDRVHILGLSLGGALGVYAAGLYADTGKLGRVMLWVPGLALRNKDFYTMDYDAVGEAKFPMVKAPMPEALAKYVETYDVMYVKSIKQLVLQGGVCQQQLENITAPTWLLYTKADPIVDPACCEDAAKRISSLVECHAYEKSNHNINLDCDKADVEARLKAWLFMDK